MLDANTDRSYFMIGAIILGALIIAGAVVIFTIAIGGEGGGKIGGLINDMFTRATSGITNIGGPSTIVPMLKGSLMGIFN